MTLNPFEKHDVLSVGIEIPGAAGGLRDPLKLDPVEMPLESTCVVIMKLAVTKVRFDPIKDTDGGLTRVHVMSVVEASFADESVVKPILDATRARLEEQKALDDAANGTPQLPLGTGTPATVPESVSTDKATGRRKTAAERLAEDAERPFDPSAATPSGVA